MSIQTQIESGGELFYVTENERKMPVATERKLYNEKITEEVRAKTKEEMFQELKNEGNHQNRKAKPSRP